MERRKRRKGKREMEWRLLIENEQENGEKKEREKKEEKQTHGKEDNFDSTVAAADLHAS